MGLLELLSQPVKNERRESALARLGFTPDRAVDPMQALYARVSVWGKPAVTKSADLERIVALPRRPVPTYEEQCETARAMTERLRRTDAPVGGCRCAELRPGIKRPCITDLKPIQGWALHEATEAQGLLGHIIAGGGKTGLDLLLPMVVPGCRRAIVLVPAALRAQFQVDYVIWSQHFRVPNLAGSTGPFWPDRPVISLIAYTQLQSPKWSTVLAAEKPDVLIGDEAQALADKESVRTHRLLRDACEREGVKYFFHSGSLTTDSIDDYAHLSALALREGSPLPIDTKTVQSWCTALDPQKGERPPAPIGELARLCEYGETGRDGFRRRLRETKGVVVTDDARYPCRLTIKERRVEVPAGVRETLAQIRKQQARPDGEEFEEYTEVLACVKQVAAGFYYFWRYPRGEPAELIDLWFKARCSWHREVRDRLQVRLPDMDSPMLVREAAIRAHSGYRGHLPTWAAQSWPAWAAIKDAVAPTQGCAWIDDFLVRDAVAWGKEKPGIIWYQLNEIGEAIAKAGGFKRYGAGQKASEEIAHEDGSRTIVAQLGNGSSGHGVGKNLQMFCRMLFSCVPAGGGIWEQALARSHREGQEAPVVEAFVYQHIPELQDAFEAAKGDAQYVQESTGKVERLLFAEIDF